MSRSRQLAASTLERYRKRLEEERVRLEEIVEELEAERQSARLSESASEHSPNPESVEGGSMAFEFEKGLSVERNANDLLAKVEHAQRRLADGDYGTCESCGDPIPTARLDALPYATTCVSCSAAR
jgi:DnaK suppressor protein